MALLEFTTSARRKFGDQATVRGQGPFGAVSLCFSNRLVLLYEKESDRNACLDRWMNCGCGAPGGDCGGDQMHRAATFAGLPTDIQAAAMPRIFHV